MKKLVLCAMLLMGTLVFAEEDDFHVYDCSSVVKSLNIPEHVTVDVNKQKEKSELEVKYDKIMNLLADKIIKLLEDGND